MKIHLLKSAALGLVLIGVGCARAPAPELHEVTLPRGSTLATTHGVNIAVSAQDSAFHGFRHGELSITNSAGRVVYHTLLTASHPAKVRLSLPVGAGTLLATLTTADGASTHANVPIAGGNATWSFE